MGGVKTPFFYYLEKQKIMTYSEYLANKPQVIIAAHTMIRIFRATETRPWESMIDFIIKEIRDCEDENEYWKQHLEDIFDLLINHFSRENINNVK